MSKTYFVNKYDDMFIELFSKKTDWKKIENIKDISGEIDFCYNVDNNDIESKLKLISKENFTKYNSIEVKKTDITYDKIVKTGDIIIKIDKRYFRPTEVNSLLGDAEKAHRKLNWKPKISLDMLIKEMIEYDLQKAKNIKLLQEQNI